MVLKRACFHIDWEMFQLCMSADFIWKKIVFLVTVFIITVSKGDVCKHAKSMLNVSGMFLTVRGSLLISDW